MIANTLGNWGDDIIEQLPGRIICGTLQIDDVNSLSGYIVPDKTEGTVHKIPVSLESFSLKNSHEQQITLLEQFKDAKVECLVVMTKNGIEARKIRINSNKISEIISPLSSENSKVGRDLEAFRKKIGNSDYISWNNKDFTSSEETFILHTIVLCEEKINMPIVLLGHTPVGKSIEFTTWSWSIYTLQRVTENSWKLISWNERSLMWTENKNRLIPSEHIVISPDARLAILNDNTASDYIIWLNKTSDLKHLNDSAHDLELWKIPYTQSIVSARLISPDDISWKVQWRIERALA